VVWDLLDVAGLTLGIISRRSGISKGQLSRLFSGERGGNTDTVLRLAEACPTVRTTELMRALVISRQSWLQRRKVKQLIDSR
jgi:hypothetical protein